MRKNDSFTVVSPNYLSKTEIARVSEETFGGRGGFRVYTPSGEHDYNPEDKLEPVDELVKSVAKLSKNFRLRQDKKH
jgi:hypothetical protein